MLFRFAGKGHANITSRHPTTIAFTKDAEVSKKGDCFVCVGADFEVSKELVAGLQKAGQVRVTIECGGVGDVINCRGDARLAPSGRELVVRKSDWVDSRTLCVGADKAAENLDKRLVGNLQKSLPVAVKLEF